jgi:hypothetical protein
MRPFATMKKLPRQRTLTEEGYYFVKPKRNARTAASLSSKYRSLVVTFTTSFTANHLLSVEPGASLLRLAPGSIFGCENMPPRKKAFSVYMGGR